MLCNYNHNCKVALTIYNVCCLLMMTLFEDSAREFEGMLIGKTHYVITLVGKRLGKLTLNGVEK